MTRYFSAIHKNYSIWKASSSGGGVSAISDYWLNTYGKCAVIYGCVLDESLKAIHIRGTCADDRNLMRGSKYIDSNISGIFRMVEKDIQAELYVLFTGRPCQIAALLSYLQIRKINYIKYLLTVEVFCHGVGSVSFFEDYVSKLEERYKSRAISGSFRAKHRPESRQDIELIFENGKRYNAASTKYDWFYSAYLKNYIIRPVCFQCQYACEHRNADISIGDYWGEEAIYERAKSLLMANSEIGLEVLTHALEAMDYFEIIKEKVHQCSLSHPSIKPADYDFFWNIYRERGYSEAQKYLKNNTLTGKMKSVLVQIVAYFHIGMVMKKLKIRILEKVSR